MSFSSKAKQRIAVVIAAVTVSLGLSSCGGGGADAGIWEGTLDGNRPVLSIVLGDGTYYMKYAGAGGTLGGLVVGTGDLNGNRYTSSDGVDYHFAYPPQAPSPATITGKLKGFTVLDGAMNTTPLSLKHQRQFDPDGKLRDLAGSYPGTVTFSLGLRTTTFVVTADGNLSTTLNGCTITGHVVPRWDDAFDLSVTFGGAPCVFPGAVFSGALVYSHDLQQLDAALVNPTYGQAITFVARKS
ncbi:hypothetical protein HHL11_26585 [Ramlibacter sp. G-1-2-2]|uniref:Lipoprotein n=1 Tax=Ramlibacter agri TaxID=2728837 RepID=A0A848HA31_9BURK|nr:hypothetical protein [Ramlibacter agri]NML47344.1 hypothetical protein [Ramlibacter agri]